MPLGSEPGTRTPCDRRCALGAFGHSDAAKRVSDAVNLHFNIMGFDCKRHWIACRLEDGKGGQTLYDTKQDAIRHQLDEYLCMYICLTGAPMSVCEAEILLVTHRKAYKAGFRMADPDTAAGGKQLIPRVALEHRLATIRAFERRR
jgi:hypothetical protein